MNEQPRTVVCSSCSAKFHVPDELIRGKLVKFRCRKCGEAIDVDGRRSAQAAAPTPRPAAEMAAVDTPATFSQRTLPPPPRPPTSSSPGLHPWPEPPRTRSTAPTAHSPSAAPPPEESSVGFETIRDPSNRGPKIAAVVALLVAAGLSGIGLAMRSTPATSAGILVHNMPPVVPSDPADPASVVPARAAGAANEGDPSHASRTPTRVTDLPVAVDGVDPAATSTALAPPKPTEPPLEKLEKKEPQAAHEEPPAGPVLRAAHNEAPAIAAPPAAAQPAAVAHPAVPDEPPAEPAPSPPAPPTVAPGAVVNAPRANAPSAPAAIANAPPPNPPAAQPANPAPAGPPAAARAANKGDFNTQAAREALEDAADRAAKCKTIDSPSGTARIAVTFAPNGQATNAVIESGPFVGTAAGTCVASKFRTVRVPPFTGEPVQVHKSIPF